MTALRVEYNSSNIAITVGIAFIGIFAGVSLCEQFRLATLASSSYKRYFILFLTACAIGWSCTWCMHSGSISSIRLYNGDEPVPIQFNSAILALAAVLSVLQTFIGLYISSTDDCFNNTRAEIMEKFIRRASTTYSMDKLKKMHKFKILFIVCTHNLTRINIGGLFGGASIAAMHYLILHSIEFQGRIEHNIGIVVAAFLFGMINGTGGFWAFFRLLSIFPSIDILRIAVTCIGVVTVCGMNYIGLASVTFYYDNDNKRVPPAGDTISSEKLYNIAIIGSLFFVIITLMLVLNDLRSWLFRTSTQLRQADRALLAVMKRSEGAAVATTGGIRSVRIPTQALHYSVKFLHRHNRNSSSIATLPCDVGSSTGLGSNLKTAPAYTSTTSRSTAINSPYGDAMIDRGVVNRNTYGKSNAGSINMKFSKLHAIYTDYHDFSDGNDSSAGGSAAGIAEASAGVESMKIVDNMHGNFHSIEESDRNVDSTFSTIEQQQYRHHHQLQEEELDISDVHQNGELDREINSRKYPLAVYRLEDDIEQGIQSVSRRWTQRNLEEQAGGAYSSSSSKKTHQGGEEEMERGQGSVRIRPQPYPYQLPSNTTITATDNTATTAIGSTSIPASTATTITGAIVRALSGREFSSSEKISPVRSLVS